MSYNDSNIPKSIFYSALVGEFLTMARSSLLYKENAMKKLWNCLKALSKIIRRHEAFANFGRNCDEILSELHI